MDLRRKTLLAVGLAVGCTLLLISLGAFLVMEQSYRTLEEKHVLHALDHTTSAMETESGFLLANLRDYAAWNETYQYLQGRNPGYLDANMRKEMFPLYGIDAVLFFDQNGTLVQGVQYYPDTDTTGPAVTPLIARVSELLPGDDRATALNGSSRVIGTPLGPALLVSHPVLTDQLTGQPAGSMHYIRVLDMQRMERLTAMTGHNISIGTGEGQFPDQGLIPFIPVPGTGQAVVIPRDSWMVSGISRVDQEGADPYYLVVSDPREIYQEGMTVIGAVTIPFLAGGVILVLVIVIFIDRTAFSRLNRIIASIRKNAAMGNGLVAGGDAGSGGAGQGDEIADLATLVDPMLEEVVRSRARALESEERLRRALDAVNDGVWDLDFSRGTFYWSPRFYGILGYSPGEITPSRENWEQLLHPDDAGEALREYDRCVKGGTDQYVQETRFRTREGAWTWAQVRGRVISRSPEGTATRLIGTITDITPRKTMEHALRDSENSYRGLFNTIRQAIYIHEADGTIIDVNEGALAMYGYSREEFIRQTPAFLQAPGRNDITLVNEKIGRALAGEPQYLEFWGRRKNGEVFPKDVWLYRGTYFGKEVLIAIASEITARKQAEEALRESEEKFRSLVEHALEGIMIVDDSGTLLFTNRRAGLLIGGDDYQELFSRIRVFDLLAPLSRQRAIRDITAVAAGAENYLVTYQVMSRGGQETWVECIGNRIRYEHAPAILLSLRDITPRRRMEEAIQASERKYRLLAEQTNDIIWTMDLDLVTTYVSPSVRKILGFTLEERMKQTVDRMVTPPSLAVVQRVLAAECAREDAGDRDPDRSVTLELEYYRKDGSVVWLESVISGIRDEKGRLAGFHGVSRDITERRNAGEALRESEERFRLLIDSVPGIAIQGYTADGIVRYWNRASERLYGYTSEEAIGKDLADLIVPDNLRLLFSGTLEVARRVARSGEFMPAGDLLLRDKSGREVQVYSIHTAVCTKGKDPVLFRIDFDLSERKRAEKALAEANRKLNLMSSITRHDIHNQVLVMQGFLQLLSGPVNNDHFREYLSYLSDATANIEKQVRFTRDYQDLGVRIAAWASVETMVWEAASSFNLREVTFGVTTGDLEIFADPLVVKVFSNLIDNSLRHATGLRRIAIGAGVTPGGICITYEDDGPGIPDDEKEKIFGKGFGKNTGLGLFLSREILGITGITIRENGLSGKGARFEILVPDGAYRYPPEHGEH